MISVEPKRFILWGAVFCIVFSFIGFFANYFRDREKLSFLTHETPAKIEKVDVQRSVSPVFGNEATSGVVVTFTYQIDERSYDRRVWLAPADATQFTPWGSAKVCYDPDDKKTIEEARLFPASYICVS